jgi:hypothetical protein
MRIFTLFIFCITFSITCVSQNRADDDVLRPVPAHWFVGPYLGAGYNLSMGRPVTQCKCDYPGGDGGGGLFGIAFDFPLRSDFSISAELGFQNLNTSYSKLEQRLYVTGPDNDLQYQMVTFLKEADVSLNLIELALLCKWHMGRRHFYVFGGPLAGLVTYDHLLETETAQTAGWHYPGSGSNRQVFFDDGLKKIYSAPLLRIALLVGTGYDIPLSARWFLSPEIGLSLPILPVTGSVPGWRIVDCHFLLALKYAV